jgi:O-antigen/teichoic acid export membrane protein
MLKRHIGKAIEFLFSSDGTLKERTVRSGIWISIASGCIRVFEVTRTIVLARLLVPELFGVMSIVLFVKGAIDVTTNTSFNSALIYRQDNIRETANTAWTLNILRGFFLCSLVYGVAPLVAVFYKEPILNSALRFISFALIVESLNNINVVIYEKNLDYRLITIFRIISSFINIVIVVLLAWVYRNIWALLVGSFLSSCFNMIITYVIQPKKPQLLFNKKIAIELFHYAKYITGAGVLVFLTLSMADVVLGKLLNLEQLGYYSYAFMLANLPSTHVTSVISEVIFPAYNTIKFDLEKISKAFFKIFRIVSLVSIPAAFGIMALSHEIIVVLLGQKWEPAVAPLRVLIVFGLIRSLAATTGPLLTAMGKQQVVFWIVFLKFCLIGALLYPCIRLWGTVGAALALTLPMLIEQLFLWYVIKKVVSLKLRSFVQAVLKAFIVSVIMWLTIIIFKLLLPSTSLLLLFVSVFFGIVVYGTITWALDKKFLIELLEFK